MNARDKEQYLREYQILKSQGKPFFPYAVLKDSVMAAIVLAVIIAMAVILGAGELANKADPTTTTYTPRPDWYFFFLFELLRVIKPPSLVILATVGIPTIALVLLALLPFYDRNPERRPERRPIATTAAFATIAAMAYLTYLGAHAEAPDKIDMHVSAAWWRDRTSRTSPAAARATSSGRRATPGPARISPISAQSSPLRRSSARSPTPPRRCRRMRTCRRRSSTRSWSSCPP